MYLFMQDTVFNDIVQIMFLFLPVILPVTYIGACFSQKIDRLKSSVR